MTENKKFAEAFAAGLFCDEDDLEEIFDSGSLGAQMLEFVQNAARPSKLSAGVPVITAVQPERVGLLFMADYCRHEQQTGYIEMLENIPELQFFKQLRLTRPSFDKILGELIAYYGQDPPGRAVPHGLKFALYVTLFYLGSQATYREISQLFGVSESTVHLCTQRVIDVLVNIRKKYIVWPSGDSLRQVEENFRQMAALPGVIGAIDGSHVRIKAPSHEQSDYINRKFEHSINLLAVACADLKFTYIYAGFPGKAHDSRVLQNSTLWHGINQGSREYFPSENYHILGDSAFPLHTHLLVPYKSTGTLRPHQQKYNQIHSKTRVVVENAFGYLKGRFRRLKYIDADIERMSSIIISCCVLHNVTLDCALERQLLESEGLERNVYDDEPSLSANVEDVQGVDKREQISLSL